MLSTALKTVTPTSTQKPENEPKSVQEQIKEARDDLAEKVSIAGFKEALDEKIVWVRIIYKIALIILGFCSIYGIYQVIIEWIKSGYTDEIVDISNMESLPFSNVTICAQSYVNESFIKENIKIPSHVAELYQNETKNPIDELYRQLTLYLAFTWKPRRFSSNMLAYFFKILRENPQTNDFSQFLKASMPSCENMLKNCHFNGRPFDCCEKAVQSLDDDRLCYMLTLNFDSDNAAPSNETVSQTRPGPKGGLSLEASISTKDIPWIEDDASNGYHVYVNAITFSAIQSPLTAPYEAETFIRVKAAKHILTKNCAPSGHLSINADPTFYHDPEGFSCFASAFFSSFRNLVPCHFPMWMYFPNQSLVCHPTSIYLGTLMLTSASMEEEYRLFTVSNTVAANDDSQSISAAGQIRANYWVKSPIISELKE